MEKHLLALVADPDDGQVHLHADLGGVDFLIGELEKIKKQLLAEECPHTHLFSEEWGGGELSVSTMLDNRQGLPVHHLKVFGWNEEWVEKHGFTRSKL